MKLKYFDLVPSSVVHNINSEIYFMNSLCQDSSHLVISQMLYEQEVNVEASAKILSEWRSEEAPFNPVDGLLWTKAVGQEFYKTEFKMIERVEVKFRNQRSFHYVPIKQSLDALLADVTV